MIRIPGRLKNKRTLLWGGSALALVVIIVSIVAARGGSGEGETVIVERRTIVEEVRVSGTVEASIVSDLGFEASGIVRDVRVKVGDIVTRAALLASLGLGTLSAELQSAQAAVAIKRSQASNTAVNLDAIRQKQDTLVKNAQIKLYSEGLVPEPNSSTYTQTPPIVSGRYTGSAGQYKLIVRLGEPSNTTDLYVFGLEKMEPVEVSETDATPLGSKGLFITFPDEISHYEGTTWYITIPNTKNPSYAANYSAYQEAVDERDRALEEAQRDIKEQSEGSSIAVAELAQAQAEVSRIQALIGERVLRAPFGGTVTAVSIDPGESVTSGTPAISLISDDAFGVEVDLPEIDSIKVRTGNTAAIVLDAFDDTTLSGTVASVNRTETNVDGVSVYEGRIALDAQDERVTSGMTADVTITTNQVADVLAIPVRAVVYRPDGTTYVMVWDTDTKEEHETDVVVGLRGSDGYVEIKAGLSEGDVVVMPSAAK